MEVPASATAPLLSPGWVSYYQELQRQLGGTVYSMGFYALPTLEPQRRAYQTAFVALRPSSTTIIGPASLDFMKHCLQEDFWFDGVHPQGKGAIVITRWLADEIIQKWPEFLATPWKIEARRLKMED